MGRAAQRILAATLALLCLLCSALPALAAEGSTEVKFRLLSSPVIESITVDCVVPIGGNQTLVVNATGVSPFAYRWQVSADGGATWVNAPLQSGAYGRTYPIANAQPNTPADTPYLYRVTVTDANGGSAFGEVSVLVSDDYSYRTQGGGDTSKPSVTGFLRDGTLLIANALNPNDPADIAPATLALMEGEIGANQQRASLFELRLVNAITGDTVMYHGKLELKFHVGAKYNGLTALVVHYHTATNRIEVLTGTVISGALTVTVNGLCPFMLVVPRDCAVSAGAGAGGSISPSGTINVPYGADQTFTFLPSSGYELGSVLVNGAAVFVTGNSYTMRNVTAASTISVAFVKAPTPTDGGGDSGGGSSTRTRTVTVTSGAHGRVSPSGRITVRYGASRSFYFYPDAGYVVDEVLVNDVPVRIVGNSYTIAAVTRNTTVAVSFRESAEGDATDEGVQHSVRVLVGAGGSVTPSGNVLVANGGDLYLYFYPDAGYALDRVSVNGVEVSVSNGMYHLINVVGACTVNVAFKPSHDAPMEDTLATITASAGAGGSISPSGELLVPVGSAQTFYFTPDTGYALEAIYVNGERLDVTAPQYTLENIAGDMQISAEFRPLEDGTHVDCRCVWARLFKRCLLCEAFGVCISPWCWLAPLLLLAVVALLWRVLLARRA